MCWYAACIVFIFGLVTMATGNTGKVLLRNGAASPWVADLRFQVGVILTWIILIYANTFNHEFALDDTIVIVGNEYVHKGAAGIPDILGKDTYFSYYDRLHTSNQLAGGRYRPLSVATFALEQQLFGPVADGDVDSLIAFGVAPKAEMAYEKRFFYEMHVRHIINVLLYALGCISLLFFFRLIVFRTNPTAAFVATLLFALHPVHTEVVANVKSRDEILSLLFICLTFISYHRFHFGGSKKWLIASLISLLLALLAKEYAVTLLALLPLCWYVCYGLNGRKAVQAIVPFLAVFILYGAMRWHAVGFNGHAVTGDIQTDPYAFASASQKTATVILTSLRYLKLLVFPYPLSADYSYNQIPYTGFGDALVWLSSVVHLALIAGLIFFTSRRSLWAIAIGWYLLPLLLVNNFLFDIGATMGERLIFHSSVGYVIALVLAGQSLVEFFGASSKQRIVAGVLLLFLVAAYSFKTVDRNQYWKNDATLFMKDIEVSPKSFLVNENVASMLVNLSDFEPDAAVREKNVRRAVDLFSYVLEKKDDYVMGRVNRAIAYLKLGMTDSTVADLETVRRLYPAYPNLPQLYYHAAMLSREQGDLQKSVAILHIATTIVPNDNELRNIVRKMETEADSVNAANGLH